jgi:YHS domain-containing protein
VSGGIREGERVVVSGNFLLDSESRMRAARNAAMPAPQAAVRQVAQTTGKSTGAATAGAVRDPVCGMTLKPAEIAVQENYGGKTYSFCSDSCRKKFLAEPGKYAGAKAGMAALPHGEAAERND